MNNLLRFSGLRLLAAVLLFVSAALASTSYTHTISTSTSSVSISNATHGIGSASLGVRVYDGSGARLASDQYSYTINASTYLVAVTLSPSRSSGRIVLQGPYAADTSNARDFAAELSKSDPENSSMWDRLTICPGCDDSSNWARRSTGGNAYVMLTAAALTVIGESGASFTVRAYLLDNKLHFGLSLASYSFSISTSCTVECDIVVGISAYPTGAVPLAHVTYTQLSNGFQSVTDDRVF